MEMELPLGWEFEEAVFSQSRERGAGGGAGPPYSAKRCEPRWFCAETSSEEDAEVLTAHKFRADLAYRERQFEKALCEYSNCLQRLPPGNIAMRRDVQEGQARCLSQLGRHKEALDIAEGMRNGATNTDHLTTVLNLQFAIYRDLENIEKKMSLSPLHIPEANLNQSEEVSDGSFKMSAGGEINLHPHRSDCQREGPQSGPEAETRSESAETCSSSQAVTETLRTSDSAGRKAEGKQAACESWEPDMAKDVGVKACASFVRARLLLQLTQLQQSSFALENNIKCQKEIDDKVAQFGLNENSLLQVTKVMGADLVPEKLKEEFQGEVKCIGSSALSSLVTTTASEFEIKWFDILRDDLRHLDGQFSPDIHIPPLAT
uniref:Chromosome 8 open reading frame 76 n=1 Tax=Coturnix japonica TaxID=93934 RepID=A0A8C2T1K1_COTJA